MNPKRANRTLNQILIICIVVASLVVMNILYTMITKAHFRSGIGVMPYSSSADKTRSITANRGYIYDRNQEIIAQDIDTYTIWILLIPASVMCRPMLWMSKLRYRNSRPF